MVNHKGTEDAKNLRELRVSVVKKQTKRIFYILPLQTFASRKLVAHLQHVKKQHK